MGSETIEAFDDIRPILDRVLSEGRSLTVTFSEPRFATHARHRCYKLRQLDRKNSRLIYLVGDARYDTSPYSKLLFELVGCTLVISPRLTSGPLGAISIVDTETGERVLEEPPELDPEPESDL